MVVALAILMMADTNSYPKLSLAIPATSSTNGAEIRPNFWPILVKFDQVWAISESTNN